MSSDHAALGEISRLDDIERVSLCEALDRVLNKGAVVVGEVAISVANVELVYLGLQLVLTSIETARESLQRGPGGVGLTIEIGQESTDAAPHSGTGRV